jgi:hypothetical protein
MKIVQATIEFSRIGKRNIFSNKKMLFLWKTTEITFIVKEIFIKEDSHQPIRANTIKWFDERKCWNVVVSLCGAQCEHFLTVSVLFRQLEASQFTCFPT